MQGFALYFAFGGRAGQRMNAETGKIVFFMPRCRHDHIRAVHKQAASLARAGHEIALVVKNHDKSDYLGMAVVSCKAPFGSPLRPLLNLPAMYRQARSLGGDVYILRNPDTIPLAFALHMARKRVIYDTHEDFSQRPLIHDGLPPVLRRATAWLITLLERWLARTISAVIVTQRQQVGKLGGRTMLLPNAPLVSGPIIERSQSLDVKRDGDAITFIYVGEITEQRGIIAMLDMIANLKADRRCVLELIGWIRSDTLKARLEEHPGWQSSRFLGAMSHAETLAHIRSADVGLAILERVADYPTSSITKLFEYMHGGIPFIASDFPAWRVETIEGAPGLYVDPVNNNALESAALALVSSQERRRTMGSAGKHFIESDFNWEQLSQPFITRANELVAESTLEGARH